MALTKMMLELQSEQLIVKSHALEKGLDTGKYDYLGLVMASLISTASQFSLQFMALDQYLTNSQKGEVEKAREAARVFCDAIESICFKMTLLVALTKELNGEDRLLGKSIARNAEKMGAAAEKVLAEVVKVADGAENTLETEYKSFDESFSDIMKYEQQVRVKMEHEKARILAA